MVAGAIHCERTFVHKAPNHIRTKHRFGLKDKSYARTTAFGLLEQPVWLRKSRP